MRIAFVADLHIANFKKFGGSVESGLNARCRLTVQTLRAAAKRATKEGCYAFVVLGDLFDTVRPEPQVIAAVQEALDFRGQIFFLVGNHDQVSTAQGDHSLGPLSIIGNVIESPSCSTVHGIDLLLVPFQPGPANEWLLEAVDTAVTKSKPGVLRRVLGLHLGISDANTPPWLQGAHDSIPKSDLKKLCEKHNIEVAVAGNWHSHQWFPCDGQMLVQAGCLNPTGFDNPGLDGYGSLIIWDSEASIRRIEIPGPRFLTFASVLSFERALHNPRNKNNSSIFVRLNVTPDEVDAALDIIDTARRSGQIVDGYVEPDKAADQAAARTAASAARSADTMEEALAAFVAGMALPDAVSREHVVERARKYLSSGVDK